MTKKSCFCGARFPSKSLYIGAKGCHEIIPRGGGPVVGEGSNPPAPPLTYAPAFKFVS